jgi:hypothetical protein
MLGGASAAPIDWKTLPYFDYQYQQFRLWTDASWKGARAVDAARLNLPADSSLPGHKLEPQWIWTETCATAAQRVVFSKTFLTPGVPMEGELALYYGPGNQFLGNRPYESAVVLINGIEIGRLGDIAHFPRKNAAELSVALTQRALKAFRYGVNTATIRVDRATLKKGERCTKPWATSGGNVRYIAVAARLSLLFGSDLRTGAPDRLLEVAHVKHGTPVTIQGVSRFFNDGPSTSLGGTVRVEVFGDGQSALVPAATNALPPLEDCKFEGQPPTSITCSYDELRAGAQTAIQVYAGTKVDTGSFRNGVGKANVRWFIDRAGVREPNRGSKPGTVNNQTTVTMLLCAPGATDPAC